MYAGLVRDGLVAQGLVPAAPGAGGIDAWGVPSEPGRPRDCCDREPPEPPSHGSRRKRTDELPDEDRTLSPYTGYTRAHWEAGGRLPARRGRPVRHREPRPLPPPRCAPSWSGRLSDGLEGYARTLLLAAFRRDEKALERYADGLAAGTAGIWPRVEDRSQPLVEAASIALALRLTRPLLWDRLDDGVRQRAAAWLGDALTAEPWACNWELFPVTVGGFLARSATSPRRREAAIDRGLERIEDWYVGDGWYTDGDGRTFDYYNGWAMHLYPVLHAHLARTTPGSLDLLRRPALPPSRRLRPRCSAATAPRCTRAAP